MMVRGSLLLTVVLLLTAIAPVASASGSAWSVQDPVDDVRPVFLSPVGGPSTGLTDTADLTGADLDDNEGEVLLTFHVKDLRVGSGVGCCISSIYLSAVLTADGSDLRHWVQAYLGSPPGAQFIADPAFATASTFSCSNDRCDWSPLDIALDDVGNGIRVAIPKFVFLGQGANGGPSLAGAPTSLAAGSKLVGISFQAAFDPPNPFLPFSTQTDDQMPDAGEAPPYVLKTTAANGIVGLHLPTAGHELAVQRETNQTVTFTARNDAPGKRILRLEYAIEAPNPAIAELYRVDGPRTIILSGQTQRNFTLSLKTMTGTTPDDGARLRIRATSAGHPEEIGFARARLVAAPALTPSANVLYVHARPIPGVGGPVDSVLCHPALPTANCENGFLSADPNAASAAPGPVRGSDRLDEQAIGERFFFVLDRPSPTALAFDRSKNLEAELHLRSATPTVGVHYEGALLFGANDAEGTVATFEGTTETSPAGTVLKVVAPVELPAGQAIPTGRLLALGIAFSVPHGSPGEAAFVSGGLEVDPEVSFVTLPLAELPESLRPATTPSPVQLAPVGPREEFANPGEARRYGLGLLNQAEASTRVELAIFEVPAGWTAEVRPGARYALEPGDALTVDLLVTPPKDAKEGDASTLRVEARVAGAAPASVLLHTTVATGVDLADDLEGYRADVDAQAKVDVAKGSSPGAGLLAGLAALGIALRRRTA